MIIEPPKGRETQKTPKTKEGQEILIDREKFTSHV